MESNDGNVTLTPDRQGGILQQIGHFCDGNLCQSNSQIDAKSPPTICKAHFRESFGDSSAEVGFDIAPKVQRQGATISTPTNQKLTPSRIQTHRSGLMTPKPKLKTPPCTAEKSTVAETPFKDEDAAFLPDDFKENFLTSQKQETPSTEVKKEHDTSNSSINDDPMCNKENKFEPGTPPQQHNSPQVSAADPEQPKVMFTLLEVQSQVAEAVENAKELLVQSAEQRIKEEIDASIQKIQLEAQDQLEEHGANWKTDHDEEMQFLKEEMEGRLKLQQKQLQEEQNNALDQQRSTMEEQAETVSQETNKLLEQIAEGKLKAQSENEEHEHLCLELRKEHEVAQQKLEFELEKTLDEMEEKENGISSFRLEASSRETELAEKIAKLEVNVKNETEEHQLLLSKSISEQDEIVDLHQQEFLTLRKEMEDALEEQKKEFENESADIAARHHEASGKETTLMNQISKLRAIVEDHHTELEMQRKKSSLEHEEATGIYEDEIQTLRKEIKDKLDLQTKAFDKEKTDMVAQHQEVSEKETELMNKISQLEAAVENGHKKLEIHLNNSRSEQDEATDIHKQELSTIRKEIEDKFEARMSEFEKEKADIVAQYQEAPGRETELMNKIIALQAIAESDQKEHGESVHKYEQDIKALREETDEKLKIQKKELEQEKEKIVEQSLVTSKKEAELMEQISMQEVTFGKEQTELKLELKQVRIQHGETLATHEHDLERLHAEMEKKMDTGNKLFEQEKADITAHHLKTAGKEGEQIVLLESKSKEDFEEFERRVEKVREEHRSEIDEMLSQLDLVEAEHSERYEENGRAVSQKDAIIAALGSQLAEATAKTKAIAKDHDKTIAMAQVSRRETLHAQEQAKVAEEMLERVRHEEKKALEVEKGKRRAACDQVKEEMIATAEEQFGKANETYMKLKHEYDVTKEMLGKFERDLAIMNKEADVTRKLHLTKDVEVTAEMAQLRASLANAEAAVARKSQKYNADVENLRVVEEDLLKKVEAANTNCATAHMSLAAVVAEKERVGKELKEMKSVCEELMAMIESGEQ